MNRCPNCGRYMNPYVEYTFCGSRCIWTCECGYTTKNNPQTYASNKIVVNNKKTLNTNCT